MFENRNLKIDLFALVLLALVVFLGLALATYSPADPVAQLVWPLSSLYQPDALVYPRSETVGNACGWWGALAADWLLTGVGLGAYYLVGSLAVVDYLLLRRKKIDAPLLRTFGWLLSLVGLTTLAAIAIPTLSPGPVIGSGGHLGALVRGLLELQFATLGGAIIAVGCLVGGVLLCTEYTLLRMGARVAKAGAKGVGWSRRLTGKRAAKTGTATDLEPSAAIDADGEEQQDEALSVRIGGKRVEVAAGDTDDDESIDDELDDDDADEEPSDEEEEAASPADAAVAGARPHFLFRRPAQKNVREQVIRDLEQAIHSEESIPYELPGLDLLLDGDDVSYEQQEKEVRRKARMLEKTFAEFGFAIKVVEIETGPVIAQYEVQLEAGLRLSKITGLADDLAIALRVPSVRIVAPLPGKNTVGIEVPNEQRQVVRLREVMEEANGKTKKMRIPLFLGKDVSGNPLAVDLSTLPHLLIAGRTGTGKSVCLNAIISSILMTRRPDEVRLLLIDPKMVELSGYARLPHLMHPVVTDMRKAEAILAWAVEKMEERYALLARAGVRHISSYNQLGEAELHERLEPENDEEKAAIPVHLPFIVIVADEMADLMMTSGKEVEQHIIRLAQKSRAVGIHLIMATQKPTVDVITGLIKSNLPARIAFQVSSRTDSRVVLDEMGADKLLGNGDMLFLWPGTSTLLRGQGTYLSDDEIERIVDSVSTGEQHFVHELVHLKLETAAPGGAAQLEKRDELYESAIDIVVREGRGSVSLLQRALGIGYGRAARLIDFMAEDGIVGAYAGSQAREVLISLEDWEQMQAANREGGGLAVPALVAEAAVSSGSGVGASTGAIGGSSSGSSGTAFIPSAKSPPAPTPRRRRNRIVPGNGWDDEEEDDEEQDCEPEDELDDEYEDDEVQDEDDGEVEDDEDDDVSDFDEDDEDEEYEEDDDEDEEDEVDESESEEGEIEEDADDDDDTDRRHGAHRRLKAPRSNRSRTDQSHRQAR